MRVAVIILMTLGRQYERMQLVITIVNTHDEERAKKATALALKASVPNLKAGTKPLGGTSSCKVMLRPCF